MAEFEDNTMGDSQLQEDISPFRPPNDEEVFVTRETEKQKKKEAKENAKYLKIWEKNTATSAAPLHRVKDRDISPADRDDKKGKSNYNLKQKNHIHRAMHIARSRVQFPQEQRAQNANEFIDQKKEMFLAELAYNTVEQEIKELEEKQQRRNQSLVDSAKELENDKMDLHHYIAQDKALKEDKEEEQKQLEQSKASKEDKIKKLEAEISTVKSTIEKNKEALGNLQENQQFLLNLSPPEFIEERNAAMNKKREDLKKRWIQDHKADPRLDYDIIFKHDEDIHDGAKIQYSFHVTKEAQAGQDKRGMRQTGKDFNDHSKMTEQDWEHAFHELLRSHLINVPDDYYTDKLHFSDPSHLTELFEKMSESCTKMIHEH